MHGEVCIWKQQEMEIKVAPSPATCPETAGAQAQNQQGKWAHGCPLTQQTLRRTRVGLAGSRRVAGRWGRGGANQAPSTNSTKPSPRAPRRMPGSPETRALHCQAGELEESKPTEFSGSHAGDPGVSVARGDRARGTSRGQASVLHSRPQRADPRSPDPGPCPAPAPPCRVLTSRRQLQPRW